MPIYINDKKNCYRIDISPPSVVSPVPSSIAKCNELINLFNFKSDLHEDLLLNSTFYSNTTSDDLEINNESTKDNILEEYLQNASIDDNEYFGDNNDSNNSDDTSNNDEYFKLLD